jgi:hypothetical protein
MVETGLVDRALHRGDTGWRDMLKDFNESGVVTGHGQEANAALV